MKSENIKLQIYILGMLLKNGSCHGYKLTQLLIKNVSEFITLKQPTIYYHLSKMEKDKLIKSKVEQEGNWPERTVFEITQNGIDALKNYLLSALKQLYKPEFSIDSVLYFFELINKEEIIGMLQKSLSEIDTKINDLLLLSSEANLSNTENEAFAINMIINHQLYHYQVEIKWIKETINKLQLKL